jgi:hypothetical protein
MFSRRDVIKAMAAMGGVFLTPFDRLGRGSPSSPVHAQNLPVGELYEGFLLLPDGASVPDFVVHPALGVPIFCGVGAAEITAVTETLASAETLAALVDFPVYELDPQDLKNLHSAGATLVKHETGEVYAAAVNYERYDSTTDRWTTGVTIEALPEFMRPYPLWERDPIEPGSPSLVLEKVDFLPQPGILTAPRQAFIGHWIETNVHYILVDERGQSKSQFRKIARRLRIS